ncbi:MAG TPA: hypothetical protein VGQ57_08140 [Polyangiaceae bacterium]|nr:hypothetical protein [Polyangiaceae bacterium]
MKLFILHDLEASRESSGALLVRAESASRAREIAADQDSWKWRDPERTTIEELAETGPSGIVWFDP